MLREIVEQVVGDSNDVNEGKLPKDVEKYIKELKKNADELGQCMVVGDKGVMISLDVESIEIDGSDAYIYGMDQFDDDVQFNIADILNFEIEK